jgi:hypothetical protein
MRQQIIFNVVCHLRNKNRLCQQKRYFLCFQTQALSEIWNMKYEYEIWATSAVIMTNTHRFHEFDAVWRGRNLLSFWRNWMPAHSVWKTWRQDLPRTLEHYYQRREIASHSSRRHFSMYAYVYASFHKWRRIFLSVTNFRFFYTRDAWEKRSYRDL